MSLLRTIAFNKPFVFFLKLINLYNTFYRFIYLPKIEKNNISYAKKNVNKLRLNPKISVIIPVYNVDLEYLEECFDSVLKQIYTNWEMCIVDDCSNSDKIVSVIEKYKKMYPNKIFVKYRKSNGNISVATNDAIKMSTGDYIALLDNDDVILENCLYEIAKIVSDYPETELIYTDEDKLLNGCRIYPFFKPEWDIVKLNIDNYISHLSVYKRKVFEEIGYFNSEFDGSQDWDFILRFSRRYKKIRHIKKILYSWRITDTSTSKDLSNKPSSVIARKKILDNIRKGYYDEKNNIAM